MYKYRLTYNGKPLPRTTKNIDAALCRLRERRQASNDVCAFRIEYKNTEFNTPWMVLGAR